MSRDRNSVRAAWFGVVAALFRGDCIHDQAPSSTHKQTTQERLAQIDAANLKRARKAAKRLRDIGRQ